MSRRGRGEDSIYREGDRWRGAASFGYGPDGRRIRKKVSGATKGEVVRKLRDLRAEMDLRLAIPDDRLTVAAFLNRWVTRNLPGPSQRSDAGQLHRHGAPALDTGAWSQGASEADRFRRG